MPQVGIEPTIPVFEQVKTVHALDRASTEFFSENTSHRISLIPGNI
jgi:hypothetical protein